MKFIEFVTPPPDIYQKEMNTLSTDYSLLCIILASSYGDKSGYKN